MVVFIMSLIGEMANKLFFIKMEIMKLSSF